MLKTLKKIVHSKDEFLEIRYHKRFSTVIQFKNGILKKGERKTLDGAGIRALVDGCWGFVSTSETDENNLRRAVDEAIKAAREASALKKEKIENLSQGDVGQGEYFLYQPDKDEPGFGEKVSELQKADERIRNSGEDIIGSIVNYHVFQDTKVIVTSNGAEAEIFDQKSEIGVVAFGAKDGKQEMAMVSNGVTGGWKDLFSREDLDKMTEKAVEIVRTKLKAGYAPGGNYTVILDPRLVGVLAHEAIGHTVEADFVLSGSVVADKIGEKVASELITLVDDGSVEGAGKVIVDDEGTASKPTVIIENGILKNYLHNRESAFMFSTEPRGNARAFTYRDQPLIRMTNTFIKPGKDKLDNMIKGVEDGFLLIGMDQGGQADATGEFMFGVQEGYRIKNGEIKEPVKGINISGQAFEVLKSADALSEEFRMDLGAGYCGKMQPAKADAGGPYLRCRVKIGGQQEEGEQDGE